MNIRLLKLAGLLVVIGFPAIASAIEITGAGSMIPSPLIKAWGETYSARNSGSTVNYQGSTPAEGLQRLINKEVDFCSSDMPLSMADLKKNGLIQFPYALGAIAPVVNLPNVYSGQLRLDGQLLGDIFLGKIKKWNDPAIAAMNPTIQLPNADIIIVRRAAQSSVRTMIGDFLAKNNPQWKASKGDGMGGDWPATSIEAKNPKELFEAILKNPYSIGYGAIPMAMRYKLSYTKLKNQAGNFVSPSDENVNAAALNAKWEESNGFDVVLSDQPGATSWPMTNTMFILMRKVSEDTERSKEIVKFFKSSLRFGDLQVVQHDYIPLPKTVTSMVNAGSFVKTGLNGIVDPKGATVLKD